MEEDAWNELLDAQGNKIVIPEGFASHMAVITVGTIRGILYEKVKDTLFKEYIIPPINLTELIQEDVVIEFSSSE
jgi:hypothetical protein